MKIEQLKYFDKLRKKYDCMIEFPGSDDPNPGIADLVDELLHRLMKRRTRKQLENLRGLARQVHRKKHAKKL